MISVFNSVSPWLRRFSRLAMLVFICGFSIPAGAVQIYRITELRFVGNVQHSDNVLRLNVQATEGTALAKETLKSLVSDDLHRLYATKLFSDVRADVDFREDQTAVVTFTVVERQRIGEVTFVGLEKLDEKRIRDALQVNSGDFLNDFQVKKSRQIILKEYLDEGYYFAKVEPRTERMSDEEVRLVFEIDEGEKVKVGRFEIVHDGDAPGMFPNLKIKWDFETGKGSVYSKEVLNNDVRKFVDKQKEKGYLLVAVEPVTELNPQTRRMDVTLKIKMGRRMRMGKVSWSGNSVVSTETLNKKMKLKYGSVLKLRKFFEGMNEVNKEYEKLGYLAVEVVQNPVILEEAGRVDFDVEIRENGIYYVESIHVEGLTKTHPKVARREIVVEEGEKWDGEKVDLSKRNLNNTGFFGDVLFLNERGSEPNAKKLRVALTEGRTGTLQLGMGFSSLNGFVAFTSISKRNFDLFDHPFKKGNQAPYFTGAGQNISTSFELGGKRSNFDVTWTHPWINDRLGSSRSSPKFPTSLTTRAFALSQEFDEYTEKRGGGRLRFGRRFNHYLTGFTQYRLEQVSLSDIQANAPASILVLGSRDDKVSALAFGATYDRTDNIFWPTRGVRITLENEIAGLGGNVEFNRPTLDMRFFRPGGWNNVWAFRVNGTSVSNPFDDDIPPDYEQFYLGGPNSVRGYDDRQIAVRTGAGNQVEGGRTAWFYNLEYRIPVLENTFSMAFFHDGGAVNEKSYEFGGNYKSSVGFGIRVETPMGPIRLDFGYRLRDTHAAAKDKGELEPHFSFGQQF